MAVILDRYDYIKEAEKKLNEKTFYQKLSNGPSQQIMVKIKPWLAVLKPEIKYENLQLIN